MTRAEAIRGSPYTFGVRARTDLVYGYRIPTLSEWPQFDIVTAPHGVFWTDWYGCCWSPSHVGAERACAKDLVNFVRGIDAVRALFHGFFDDIVQQSVGSFHHFCPECILGSSLSNHGVKKLRTGFLHSNGVAGESDIIRPAPFFATMDQLFAENALVAKCIRNHDSAERSLLDECNNLCHTQFGDDHRVSCLDYLTSGVTAYPFESSGFLL